MHIRTNLGIFFFNLGTLSYPTCLKKEHKLKKLTERLKNFIQQII
jgi:hypothetical protein